MGGELQEGAGRDGGAGRGCVIVAPARLEMKLNKTSAPEPRWQPPYYPV